MKLGKYNKYWIYTNWLINMCVEDDKIKEHILSKIYADNEESLLKFFENFDDEEKITTKLCKKYQKDQNKVEKGVVEKKPRKKRSKKQVSEVIDEKDEFINKLINAAQSNLQLEEYLN